MHGSPIKSVSLSLFVPLACKWVAAGCSLALQQPISCWRLRCQAGDATVLHRCDMPARSHRLKSGEPCVWQRECQVPLSLQHCTDRSNACNRTLSAGWQLLRLALERGAPWGCDCLAAAAMAVALHAPAADMSVNRLARKWWCRIDACDIPVKASSDVPLHFHATATRGCTQVQASSPTCGCVACAWAADHSASISMRDSSSVASCSSSRRSPCSTR
jgi:hypothetical protein